MRHMLKITAKLQSIELAVVFAIESTLPSSKLSHVTALA